MRAITDAQKRVLDFITDYIETNDFPPTMREICEGTGLSSKATVHTHLHALVRKGFIELGKARYVLPMRIVS